MSEEDGLSLLNLGSSQGFVINPNHTGQMIRIHKWYKSAHVCCIVTHSVMMHHEYMHVRIWKRCGFLWLFNLRKRKKTLSGLLITFFMIKWQYLKAFSSSAIILYTDICLGLHSDMFRFIQWYMFRHSQYYSNKVKFITVMHKLPIFKLSFKLPPPS